MVGLSGVGVLNYMWEWNVFIVIFSFSYWYFLYVRNIRYTLYYLVIYHTVHLKFYLELVFSTLSKGYWRHPYSVAANLAQWEAFFDFLYRPIQMTWYFILPVFTNNWLSIINQVSLAFSYFWQEVGLLFV